MKRKDIEKAAADYSGMALGFNHEPARAAHEAFAKGAEHVINLLCNIPLDKVLYELNEYITEKNGENETGSCF